MNVASALNTPGRISSGSTAASSSLATVLLCPGFEEELAISVDSLHRAIYHRAFLLQQWQMRGLVTDAKAFLSRRKMSKELHRDN